MVGCSILAHAILPLKQYLIRRFSSNGATFMEPMTQSCIQSIKQESNKIGWPPDLA